MNWQLADAKNRFSEVVRKALAEGPQRVTRRGDAVIVLSEADYEALRGEKPRLVDMLASAPSFDGLDLDRDPSPMRDVEL